MNRSRSRAFINAAGAAALIAGLLVGTTGATLAADNRVVYLGDPAGVAPDGVPDDWNGKLVITPVTTSGVFVFDVTAKNLGGQNLTHATFGLGSDAAFRAGWDSVAKPSLPVGAEILSATLPGRACTVNAAGSGATCDAVSLGAGAAVTATFIVRAPATPVDGWAWASFKVAENVNDQGANRNSFFADSALPIGPTTSNATSTFLLGNQSLRLSTAGQAAQVAGDRQLTTVEVPGAAGGLVSLVETDGPTGCTPKCIGQTVSANVRGGAALSPYLKWTLVIFQTDVVAAKGGIIHTLDDGTDQAIANTKANACSTKLPTDCIESYVVNKKAGTTTIVFRTPTNGAVRAH